MSSAPASRLRPYPLAAVALALLAAGPPASSAIGPAGLSGLVALWSEETLHRTHRDGERVVRWPDAGPHGHDLREDAVGMPTVFRTVQAAGRPAIVVGRDSRFSLERPFTLEDHTIVVVYASSTTRRGLLSSADAPLRGIVIHDSSARDYLQGPGGRTFYGTPLARDDRFHVLVLGRRAGVLHAFVDGASRSYRGYDPAPIPVDRLFAIDHTRVVRSDGGGLRIAQIAIFDRYLTDDERNALTASLGTRYGIGTVADATPRPVDDAAPVTVFTWPESKVLLRVASDATLDLSADASLVPWTRATRVRAPLHHDARLAPTRVSSLADDRPVWVSVLLVAPWRAPPPAFRVLLLADGERYLEHEARPERVERDDGPWLEARLDAALRLDAGSTIEVVVAGEGEGTLRLDPASRLLATTEPPTVRRILPGAAAPR